MLNMDTIWVKKKIRSHMHIYALDVTRRKHKKMVTVVAFRKQNWETGKQGVEKRFIFHDILFLTFSILYFVHLLPSQKLHLKNTNSESTPFSDHLENAYRHDY